MYSDFVHFSDDIFTNIQCCFIFIHPFHIFSNINVLNNLQARILLYSGN